MKIKSFIIAGLALCAMTSCDESFDDWAQQSGNEQPAIATFGEGTVAAAADIDFATVAEGTETVKVCSLTAPTTSVAESEIFYKLVLGDKTYDLNADGTMNYGEFKDYVEATYGLRPVFNEITAKVYAFIGSADTKVKFMSDPFIIKAKPEAPVIYDKLYLIGGFEGTSWDPTSTTLPFNHSGKDVYEDPVFTIMVPVTDGDYWFAFADEYSASYNVETGKWDMVFGAKEGNGSNVVGDWGVLARRTDIGNDGSFTVKVEGDAKYLKITCDMLARKYKIEKLNFQQFYYVAGNGNGWKWNDFVGTTTYDGEYTGLMWLGTEFKFCSQPNWDGTNYGADFSTDGGAGNMTLPEGLSEGYYKVDFSLASNTVKFTEVTTIGVIGDATPLGWDASTPLTYNKDGRCWEGDVTFNDGTFKFRANNAWDINWGGNKDDLSFGGDNIPVTAGTYHVVLYPNCPGKAYCTLTAQ